MLGRLQEKVREVSDDVTVSNSSTGYAARWPQMYRENKHVARSTPILCSTLYSELC